MDPVSAVANALGQLFGAVGQPIAISQQRKLIEDQSRYQYASDVIAAQEAEAADKRKLDRYLIIGAILLVAVALFVVNRK